MAWNLPNILTWLRIIAIPLVVVLFYLPYPWSNASAALLFSAAAITDSLDGYFARRMGLTSRLGAFLDPVADKLIVAVALVLLVSQNHAGLHWLVALSACVIIGREIAISALREWMAELGERARVAVSPLGKVKTIVQMTGIPMMLWREDLFGLPVYQIGLWLTTAAAILTLWSMISYLRAAWPVLTAPEAGRQG
ncbi:MAG: CDP-diacylglycerol--glycerol-3-phosphate 3-phosphatidyltransferase [Pseudomonadota bacterium]|nr:CDP-diacylglycerol--glycerol-3-phosphate 3-phosphatidyltransferase [Pseudomonadota bacterium]